MTPTIAVVIGDAARRLAAAGIDDARLEARLLLAEALQVDAAALIAHPEQAVPNGPFSRFEAGLARRLGREPMAQILGRREFWGLPFRVTRDTLAPRPDSEAVVGAALAQIPDRTGRLRLLDIGTGTGCLLLALLSELPAAGGLGLDRSAAALVVARGNADSLGMAARARFAAGDWLAGIEGVFDLIVCNPPYIPTGEIDALMPEVSRHEPRLALDGGADGLDAYRALAPAVADHLAPGGVLAVEVGAGQAAAVRAVLEPPGLRWLATAPDLGARERCLVFGKI